MFYKLDYFRNKIFYNYKKYNNQKIERLYLVYKLEFKGKNDSFVGQCFKLRIITVMITFEMLITVDELNIKTTFKSFVIQLFHVLLILGLFWLITKTVFQNKKFESPFE